MLVSTISDEIGVNDNLGNLQNREVELGEHLAIVLRLLCDVSYLHRMLNWNIFKPRVYDLYHSTVEVFLKELKFSAFIFLKETYESLTQEFFASRCTNNPLGGCVGALDGVAMTMRAPEIIPVIKRWSRRSLCREKTVKRPKLTHVYTGCNRLKPHWTAYEMFTF